MSNKKTILVLANNSGGLFNFRGELLKALSTDYEIICAVPTDDYTPQLNSLGAKCIVVPLNSRGTNPIRDIKLCTQYVKLLKRIKPDIVITYTIKPNIYGGIACTLRKVPYIANVTGLGTSIENGGLLAFVTKNMYRVGIQKATCVFFQNTSNRALFIREGLVKGKTRLLPGSGVNLEKHYAEPYPDDTKGISFLFAGRVMKDKGIDELIQAMRMIHSEFPNTKMVIIGRCEENYSSYLKQAEQFGVQYLGLQSDVHGFYKNSHCVVLPSYHEGTSNVMLEASATARPVITTRVPGCRETFDEGVTGFGCEAKDAESLADAMRKFMNLTQSEREQMGKAARAKMEREYDRNIVIRAYKEEINNITKED